VTKRLSAYGVDFTAFAKTDVNGANTHPVWHFLRYNAAETGSKSGKISSIPWNFTKFLVDKEGHVFKYYGPGVKTPQIEADVRSLLEGKAQGAKSKAPTVTPDKAPPGFAPVKFNASMVQGGLEGEEGSAGHSAESGLGATE